MALFDIRNGMNKYLQKAGHEILWKLCCGIFIGPEVLHDMRCLLPIVEGFLRRDLELAPLPSLNRSSPGRFVIHLAM